MNIAIILASGQGKRMGADKNKVLLELHRKPLIYHTLSAFEKTPEISEILIVCKKEELAYFQKITQKYNLQKVTAFVEGGYERQDSAFNAVSYLDNILPKRNSCVVIFHNGANPLVTSQEIASSIKGARRHGACAIAHPTKDTIKEVDHKIFVRKTLERKHLWNMQTPQAIKFNLAKEAFSKAKQDNFTGTDDVSLVERLGKKVKIIQGSLFNFKITTPLDLELAKIILKRNQ